MYNYRAILNITSMTKLSEEKAVYFHKFSIYFCMFGMKESKFFPDCIATVETNISLQNPVKNGKIPLSSTNISGGAARHEKVSPKTWRILAFADAIWFLSLQVFTTEQPRSRAFKKTFAPLAFAKKFMAWLFSGKNQR